MTWPPPPSRTPQQGPRHPIIKQPVEDAASHSSGSTSDSGRGGSDEGDSHSHNVVVTLGNENGE